MRKWMAAVLGVLAVLIVGAGVYVLATALRSEHPVGFQTVTVDDPTGAPLTVGIWYPTKAMTWPTLTGLLMQFVARDAPVDGSKHPLIILSHGIAGSLSSHADTALALADAGFIVAAPLHTGDNYRDQSAIGTTNWFTDRARHVHLTISYMLEEWADRARINGTKIGIFGFSAGGTTALIALGGMPDLDQIKSHCATVKEFACDVWRKKNAATPAADEFVHDPRIKAAVVIAPGAGFAFARYGLQNVHVPVQLWGAEKDESVPTASNADVVRRELGQRAEWHLVKNAGHFSFMVPCGPAGLLAPKLICSDLPGFDRSAFHRALNRQVVAFFKKKLAEASPYVCTTGWHHKYCFTNEYIAAVNKDGMAGSWDLFGARTTNKTAPSNLGVEITIGLNDFEAALAADDMHRVCSAHWCIFYGKECAAPLHHCRYLVSVPVHSDVAATVKWVTEGEPILLQANSADDFLRAEQAILIGLPGDGSAAEYITLSRLNQSGGFNPGMCDPRTAVNVCHKLSRW